jgi:hypothetical protein
MTDDDGRERVIRNNHIRAEGAQMVAKAIARRYGSPYGWGPPIQTGYDFKHEVVAKACHEIAEDIIITLKGKKP